MGKSLLSDCSVNDSLVKIYSQILESFKYKSSKDFTRSPAQAYGGDEVTFALKSSAYFFSSLNFSMTGWSWFSLNFWNWIPRMSLSSSQSDPSTQPKSSLISPTCSSHPRRISSSALTASSSFLVISCDSVIFSRAIPTAFPNSSVCLVISSPFSSISPASAQLAMALAMVFVIGPTFVTAFRIDNPVLLLLLESYQASYAA